MLSLYLELPEIIPRVGVKLLPLNDGFVDGSMNKGQGSEGSCLAVSWPSLNGPEKANDFWREQPFSPTILAASRRPLR